MPVLDEEMIREHADVLYPAFMLGEHTQRFLQMDLSADPSIPRCRYRDTSTGSLSPPRTLYQP
ncbi:hypothetical protein ISS40_05035 [Candidatus Bathyarchaeota archaeon]|nr:hypothetical protein [Candidatus Bathyarchaeota archaeon]